MKLSPDDRNQLNAMMLGLSGMDSKKKTEERIALCIKDVGPFSESLQKILDLYVSSLPLGELNDIILQKIADGFKADGNWQLGNSLSWALEFTDPRRRAACAKCPHCGK